MPLVCFDPVGGAAGDMILAALLDAGADPREVVRQIQTTGLHEFDLRFERRQDDRHILCGFCEVRDLPHSAASGPAHGHRHDTPGAASRGVHDHADEHSHGPADAHAHEEHSTHDRGEGRRHGCTHQHGRHLPEILELIDAGELAERTKNRARRIFRRLADAEAAVHGIEPDLVHFHEVGAVDSIVDVLGVCIALELLDIDTVYSSAFKIGSGTVECAHGILPVPAPATVKLLEGWPVVRLPVERELTTPTGAAILTTLSAGPWVSMPLTMIRSGTGHGTRNLREVPNVIRAYRCKGAPELEPLQMLQTDIDDDTPERLAYVAERLRSLGARDVVLSAVTMKKGRPGTRLEALFGAETVPAAVDALLTETSTLGVRAFPVQRYALEREKVDIPTPWGPVKGKRVRRPDGPETIPEFESCRAVADSAKVPLRKVMQTASGQDGRGCGGNRRQPVATGDTPSDPAT